MWNGLIDWAKVKASGIYGVIIRAGYGRVISQKDSAFERNYAGALAAGLHIGAYWYSYAESAEVAMIEANVFMQVLKGKKFDLPVYFDIEEAKQVKLSKTICDGMVTEFCTTLEKAGYFAGVYSFDSFFNSNLSTAIVQRFSAWAARVENIKPTSCKAYGMHQYSWLGKVDGCNGDVDMNYCYKDFPAIIKAKKLNGYNT